MNNEDLQNEEIDEVNTPSEENEEARTDKEYSDDYLTSAIEAILFSVGESVSIDRLASALEMDKRKLTKQYVLCTRNLLHYTRDKYRVF